MTGSFHLYPKSECIHEWTAVDGKSSGSMVMKIVKYVQDETIQLSLENINVTFKKNNSLWKVSEENGWNNPIHSILEASITEVSANKVLLHRPPTSGAGEL